MGWPFPKRCFCLACFRLLLLSMTSIICFSSCVSSSSFIFCQITLQISEYPMLSVRLPFLFIWYVLTACRVSYFCICGLLKRQLHGSSSQLHYPLSQDRLVESMWALQIYSGVRLGILSYDVATPAFNFFGWVTIFALSNLMSILAFPIIMQWSLPVLRLLMTETSRKMSGLSVMV